MGTFALWFIRAIKAIVGALFLGVGVKSLLSTEWLTAALGLALGSYFLGTAIWAERFSKWWMSERKS